MSRDDETPRPPRRLESRFSNRLEAVLAYGYATWFVGVLAVLGYLAGWSWDRGYNRPWGRVFFTFAGIVAGALIAWTLVLRPPRRRGSASPPP